MIIPIFQKKKLIRFLTVLKCINIQAKRAREEEGETAITLDQLNLEDTLLEDRIGKPVTTNTSKR